MTVTTDAPAATLAAWRPAVITEPGVYDIRHDDYHRDPVPGGSLSNSEAKWLLEPGCPARFRWEKDHVRPPKREFDIGTAAHTLVLGTGPELVRVEADNWRTDRAKAAAAEARERGAVPLLPAEYAMVNDMAAALRRHPGARALFDPDRGEPERSLFWTDPATGVMRRSRLDHFPYPHHGRMLLADYKTCTSAAIEAVRKVLHNLGYHRQGATYLDGAQALGRAGADAQYLLVFQEKTAPYLVRIFYLNPMALAIARDLNARALELYAECAAADHWPGWEETEPLGVPGWVERAHLRGEK